MAENTKIEWATHTFNPWEGCQKVGPGCDHCYAETRNARFGGGTAPNWGPGAPRRRTSAANWRKPLAWDLEAAGTGIRPRVFCASLADVFDNAVDPEWRADLFKLIRATPNLDWLLLTKRIGNVEEMLPDGWEDEPGGCWENVWIGATVVNQAEAVRDIPKLLDIPARVRFLSIEPLLGPINFHVGQGFGLLHKECPKFEGTIMDPSTGMYECCSSCDYTGITDTIDWVIVGGESGPGARPMHPDWARDVRAQCAAAGVPFFFKQWGEWEAALDRDRDDPDWRADYTNDYVDRGKSKWLNLAGGCGFHGERFHVMRRVGKAAAGRLLDGVQHDGVPA